MTVTKILGAQAGIQYPGVQDKSEADPRDALVNALFTGDFKNGPFNKPFKVTAANIRAKLGFDPENLQYQAIEDALKQGIPFVLVMRVSGGTGEGVSIDTSKLTYPAQNGIIAFKLNDPDKRISINVDGKDLKGSMSEVIDQLAVNYGIYITYLRDGQILFTTSSQTPTHIAIQGVDGHNRQDNYFTQFDSDDGYCEVGQFGDIYTFTLIRTRDYAAIPLGNYGNFINELDLNDTLNISMAKSAVAYSKSDLFLNKLVLDNWIDAGGNPMTLSTPVTYSYPVPETLTFAQVQQKRLEADQYAYTYNKIICYTLAKTINDGLGRDFIYYSSNIGEFSQMNNGQGYRGNNEYLVYMDFTKAQAWMLKGYMPIIGRPS